VVLSYPRNLLGWPRSLIWTFSSLMPRSSVIALPPVGSNVLQHGLATVAEAGALTAQTCSFPQFIDHERGDASPSTSSATINNACCSWQSAPAKAAVLHRADFLSLIRM